VRIKFIGFQDSKQKSQPNNIFGIIIVAVELAFIFIFIKISIIWQYKVKFNSMHLKKF